MYLDTEEEERNKHEADRGRMRAIQVCICIYISSMYKNSLCVCARVLFVYYNPSIGRHWQLLACIISEQVLTLNANTRS